MREELADTRGREEEEVGLDGEIEQWEQGVRREYGREGILWICDCVERKKMVRRAVGERREEGEHERGQPCIRVWM